MAPHGPAAGPLLLSLRRSPDPCGDGRRRGRADRSSVRDGPANPFTVAAARAPPSMTRRASYPGMDRGACDIGEGHGRWRVGPRGDLMALAWLVPCMPWMGWKKLGGEAPCPCWSWSTTNTVGNAAMTDKALHDAA